MNEQETHTGLGNQTPSPCGRLDENIALVTTTYFGPIQWYQKLNRYKTCYIERYDNFVKQTYRNRCVIATANGTQKLTIPVEGTDEKGGKILDRDIRISDHGNWRHLHWNALSSAYGESPFFEFYADDLRPFFERRWTYLYDFNWEITLKICELLDIQPDIHPTTDYLPEEKSDESGNLSFLRSDGTADFRSAIRPKHPLPDPSFEPQPYYQVFRQKKEQAFMPNLSILDLLFNEGNEAVLYL